MYTFIYILFFLKKIIIFSYWAQILLEFSQIIRLRNQNSNNLNQKIRDLLLEAKEKCQKVNFL